MAFEAVAWMASLKAARNARIAGSAVAPERTPVVSLRRGWPGRARTRAAGGGTILFTGGGWADYPIPAWGTVSLGKVALRSAATMLGAELADDGIRVASLTIAGQIQQGTPFGPERIAEKYWSIVQSDGTWQSEFRFDGT